MSSYELLELLEYMPDKGAFKTAIRGGEWTEETQIWAHIANELSKLRATTHAVHGGEKYAPMVFLTLAERKKIADDQAQVEDAREAFYSFADRGTKKLVTGGN